MRAEKGPRAAQPASEAPRKELEEALVHPCQPVSVAPQARTWAGEQAGAGGRIEASPGANVPLIFPPPPREELKSHPASQAPGLCKNKYHHPQTATQALFPAKKEELTNPFESLVD